MDSRMDEHGIPGSMTGDVVDDTPDDLTRFVPKVLPVRVMMGPGISLSYLDEDEWMDDEDEMDADWEEDW